jgi:serine/threonine-protein kinase
MEHDPEPPVEPDWPVLFAAAGLDMAAFDPIPPRAQPTTFGDTRAAWEGVLPHRGDLPVRVEAISLRGKPVFFETVTPYDPYWSDETAEARRAGPGSTVETILLALFVLVAVAAVVLAARHWRMGRGDRRGALRLAIYVLILEILSWMFTGHHVPSFQQEFGILLLALAGGLVLALLCWVLYMALEPYFRRLWPKTLVSWARLLAGRFRDPLVGRDILAGCTFGVGLTVFVNVGLLIPAWLGLPPLAPESLAMETLRGGRWAVGALFQVQLAGLAVPLAYLVLLLLLRLVLRVPWLAAGAFAAIICAFWALSYGPIGAEAASPGRIAVGAVLGALWGAGMVAIILRFGVLALVSTFVMAHLVLLFPLTLDTAAPYFATSVLGMAAALALAGWSFYVALAGRSFFQDAVFQEQV